MEEGELVINALGREEKEKRGNTWVEYMKIVLTQIESNPYQYTTHTSI